MNMNTDDPRNPYHSYIVNASAGTGKTWQLSQRFLFLVAAQANPTEILTITFTRKAAAEMRARVIDLATNLITDKNACREFDQTINFFWQEFIRRNSLSLQPPRPAQQVGEKIFYQAQKLKIATMDSIFSEWLSSLACQGFDDIPYPFKIISAEQMSEIKERSWQKLWLRYFPCSEHEDALLREEGSYKIKRLVEYLAAIDTDYDFLPHPLAEGCDGSEIIAQLVSLLPAQVSPISTIPDLLKAGIITRQKKINRKLFSPEAKKACKTQLEMLDRDIKIYLDKQKLQQLNMRGEFYFKIHALFQEIYQELKKEKKLLDFSDLATTVHRLFMTDAGAEFFLQQRITHLLLDEFQDTSNLQWQIWRETSRELLAGDNLAYAKRSLRSTIFVVGDTKQSIYGFREANPRIMAEATADLQMLAPRQYQLKENFRTARHLLDFFNVIFKDFDLKDFYPQQAAKEQGQDRVKNFGEIILAPLETTCIGEEAEFVATYIASMLKQKPNLQAGDFCILYRNATHADVFQTALAQKNIDNQKFEEQGFFRSQEIADMLAFCKWLVTPEDQHALLTVLRSPICHIPEVEVLAAYTNHDARGVAAMLDALAKNYPVIVSTLREINTQKNDIPPYQLLFYALYQLDVLASYEKLFSGFAGTLASHNILQFIDILIILDREGFRGLAAVYMQLKTLAAHDIVGTDVSAANTVKLMTIHKAKGLEFPFVILVQAQDKWEKRDTYWAKLRKKNALTFVGTEKERPSCDPDFTAIYNNNDQDTVEEEMRLLYVALTRAKHYLLVTGKKPKKGESKGFLLRIIQAVHTSDLRYEKKEIDGTEVTCLPQDEEDEQPLVTQTEKKPPVPVPDTATGLRQEIKILHPHNRKAIDVSLLVYDPSSRAYGIYLHKLLEYEVKNKSLSVVEIANIDHTIRKKAEQTFKNLLTSNTWQDIFHDIEWAKAEMPIVCLNPDSYLIKGVIDLLVCYPQRRLKLIDYKTTEHKRDIEPYRQQLTLYGQAVRELYPDHTLELAVLFTADCSLVYL